MKNNKRSTPKEDAQINEQLKDATEPMQPEETVEESTAVATEEEWRAALETAVKQRDE